MHLVSSVRRLRQHPAPEARRLLRVLLLWLGAVPAGAGRPGVLQHPPSMNASTAESKDWTRGARGLLTWCLPAAILLVSPVLGERYLVVIWPIVLTFMGSACLLNARRCGRVHCYLTGPFFLLLAAVALLHGLGLVPLGRNGWGRLAEVLVVGSVLLLCGPEWLLGRYRSRV